MLTPLDIQNAVFHRTFRGYSEAEVDEFLDRVVAEYEQLYRENLALKEQLASAREAAATATGSYRFGAAAEREAPAPVAFRPAPVAEAAVDPAEVSARREELERLNAAVEEETARLEGLRQQAKLFVKRFRSALESYQLLTSETEQRLGRLTP
ncbi:MAG: DivIVA domain-containing protein [Chitinophagales bacterium]